MPRPAVVIATHNRHKLTEIRKILKSPTFRVRGLDDFPPPYTVRETGKTLEANALLKARKAARVTGLLSLSDDTGLDVAALGGRPGVYSARFAGPNCSFEDNNRKLLRLLRGVPRSKRRAVFRTVVAAVFPDGREKIFEGRCPGWITDDFQGAHGFGYDPVFAPGRSRRTFAQLTLAQKNRVSHRARAFQKARAFLLKTFRRAR
jgi:XTP/dITP diphosphohydrolase